MPATAWSGRAVQRAREVVVAWLPAPCGQCGETVTAADRWVVGHKIARSIRPDLAFEVSNWRPEHRACSDKSAQAVVIEKARAEGARDALAGAGFSPEAGAREPSRLPVHTHGAKIDPLDVREELAWTSHVQSAPAWLRPYLDVPENAAPPLAMTPVHPRAVCSYAAASCPHAWRGVPFVNPPTAIAWVEENLPDVTELRWWQRLAFVRQLEHDQDGALCWRVVVESGPRRIGKSVRLRGMALWRLAVGPLLFRETQLAIHTGMDRQIVKEIHRKAWTWARSRPGWDVRTGAGMEEVSVNEEHRWLVKSTDAVYGFDTTLGYVDEAWAVSPGTVDDGLEPSTMERMSAQCVLTSTAHRRATSLMRRRISDAMAAEDGETLLLLWGARPQDDPAAEPTWRAASPHWSEDRRRMIGSKYARALTGEADPEADDPDPVAGWASQYLNLWRLRERASKRGDGVTSAEAWDDLVVEPPFAVPDAAAIESWFAEGVSLALAWKVGPRVVVRVSDHTDLAAAAAAIRDAGVRSYVTVGRSLYDDPALRRLRRRKGEARTATVVQELDRMLTDDVVRHDGGSHLTDQLLGIRTVPGPDGPRIVSSSRADAVKAAVWAANRAKLARSAKVRVLVSQ